MLTRSQFGSPKPLRRQYTSCEKTAMKKDVSKLRETASSPVVAPKRRIKLLLKLLDWLQKERDELKKPKT